MSAAWRRSLEATERASFLKTSSKRIFPVSTDRPPWGDASRKNTGTMARSQGDPPGSLRGQCRGGRSFKGVEPSWVGVWRGTRPGVEERLRNDYSLPGVRVHQSQKRARISAGIVPVRPVVKVRGTADKSLLCGVRALDALVAH